MNKLFLKASVIACLCLAFAPTLACAQQNIISAFDAIKNCKGAEIEESHFLERDPETGVKIGQSDVWEFTLPKGKMDLIKDALRAFNEDNEKAYSVSSGEKSSKSQDVVLAVGDGKGNNVKLTSDDCHYIYACFLAPKSEDPDGTHRYAYAMSYDDFGEEIEGILAITYATTMKHRQDNSTSVRGLNRLEAWTSGSRGIPAKGPWMRDFMRYVTALGYSKGNTRATSAGYLYEIVSGMDKYPEVSEQDKKTARAILDTLINDKAYSDPIVQQILKGAFDAIK